MHAKVKQGGVEDAFFVADLASVVRQYAQWRAELPRIEPFYAVKCNPDPVVVALLAELGANFDCASKEEIRRVIATGTPNAASRIIYANPCKAASHLRFAAESGVQMMTFDNADELHKIKKHHPTAGLLLRIITDDSKSLCQFGLKFGAHLDRIKPLLSLAKELELNIL
ncbi:Orn/DAP/Arg decarboxylase 2, partial [Ramicandelaber brevisporus]